MPSKPLDSLPPMRTGDGGPSGQDVVDGDLTDLLTVDHDGDGLPGAKTAHDG